MIPERRLLELMGKFNELSGHDFHYFAQPQGYEWENGAKTKQKIFQNVLRRCVWLAYTFWRCAGNVLLASLRFNSTTLINNNISIKLDVLAFSFPPFGASRNRSAQNYFEFINIVLTNNFSKETKAAVNSTPRGCCCEQEVFTFWRANLTMAMLYLQKAKRVAAHIALAPFTRHQQLIKYSSLRIILRIAKSRKYSIFASQRESGDPSNNLAIFHPNGGAIFLRNILFTPC